MPLQKQGKDGGPPSQLLSWSVRTTAKQEGRCPSDTEQWEIHALKFYRLRQPGSNAASSGAEHAVSNDME